jgi:hypothetical protein
MKIWLNVSEGAKYAGVCRDTIYTACERGELHHIRIGGPAFDATEAGMDQPVVRAPRPPSACGRAGVGG